MHKLHDLKKTLIESLEEFADKGVTNATDLKTVDTMAHAIKNLGKVIEMCDEEESGSSFRRGSYRGSYDDRPRVSRWSLLAGRDVAVLAQEPGNVNLKIVGYSLYGRVTRRDTELPTRNSGSGHRDVSYVAEIGNGDASVLTETG